MNKALPAVGLVIILAAIGIVAVSFSGSNAVPPVGTNNPPVNNPPVTTVSRTIEGVMVCLPHKNTDGPQTMECAFGMRADDGSYYALDWSVADPNGTSNLPMDRRYAVTGMFTPIEAISSNFWDRYNVRGIMKVEKYSEVGVKQVSQIIRLKLNQDSVPVLGTTIKVWAVTEDSRCPSDVQCIQAGRVKVGLNLNSPSGASVRELQPGQFVTTETLSITLDSVEPVPVSTRKIGDNEYRFNFTLKSR